LFKKEESMKKAIGTLLLILVLFGTISLVACGPTETRTNAFSVGSSPSVEVKVGNGNVSLVVGPEGEIMVTAELQNPEEIEYQVSQDGDSITVDAKTRSGSRADVTVTMPRNTEFGLSTGNGNVDAVSVQASGAVNVGNGSIVLDGVKGHVFGNVGNGNITLSDAAGSFNLNVGNGNIGFQGELTPGGESRFNVGNGSVTMELPGSPKGGIFPSVTLDLEVEQDGKVRCDWPVTVQEQAEQRLVGTIGDGEAALTVRIGNGNITIAQAAH